MNRYLSYLRFRLGMLLMAGRGQALVERQRRLESALANAKAKNESLALELGKQRQKTRELYQRNKEYADRLRRGAGR